MKAILRAAGMTLLVVIIGSCSMFDYSSIVSNKYAIVYGVTNYVSTNDYFLTAGNSPNLSYPDADARDVTAMLSEKGYSVISRWVDGSNNVWYNGTNEGAVSYYTNASYSIHDSPGEAYVPSKANLSVDLAALKSKIGPNDIFLFYFSGHGTQAGSVEYFDPYGAVTYNGGYSANGSLCVADTEMGALLSEYIGTSRKVVILDSCNSGGFIGNTLEVDTTPTTTAPYDWTLITPLTILQAIENYTRFTTTSTAVSPYNAQVLSAAGTDESSYDDVGHAHGAMSYYLLKIPANGDLNGDGKVTVLEAFSFVKAAIQAGWNVVNPGEAFTPHVSGGPVDFVMF